MNEPTYRDKVGDEELKALLESDPVMVRLVKALDEFNAAEHERKTRLLQEAQRNQQLQTDLEEEMRLLKGRRNTAMALAKTCNKAAKYTKVGGKFLERKIMLRKKHLHRWALRKHLQLRAAEFRKLWT